MFVELFNYTAFLTFNTDVFEYTESPFPFAAHCWYICSRVISFFQVFSRFAFRVCAQCRFRSLGRPKTNGTSHEFVLFCLRTHHFASALRFRVHISWSHLICCRIIWRAFVCVTSCFRIFCTLQSSFVVIHHVFSEFVVTSCVLAFGRAVYAFMLSFSTDLLVAY